MNTGLIAVAGLIGGVVASLAAAVGVPESAAMVNPSRTQATPPETKPEPAAAPASADGKAVVERLVAEAETLAPLVESAAARAFLAATRELPVVETRVVYRKPGAAISEAAWGKLTEEERAAYTPRPCTPEFYFYTGYGSPLVYARVVELMARHSAGGGGFSGKRVLDFGYGTIGHLRLMAQLGAETHGVEIEPLFEALYSDPLDLRGATSEQAVFLHTGRWPADAELVQRVASRGTFDVITSKNTLKKGYVHPEPPAGKTVDERQLVKLGVEDAAFLAAVRDALTPGGLFIIYNISPAQSPAEDVTKPYLPMADGRSPFSREQYEAAGFEVVKLDEDDQAWVLECWRALGYDRGKAKEEAAKDVFALYTVVRKK